MVLAFIDFSYSTTPVGTVLFVLLALYNVDIRSFLSIPTTPFIHFYCVFTNTSKLHRIIDFSERLAELKFFIFCLKTFCNNGVYTKIGKPDLVSAFS